MIGSAVISGACGRALPQPARSQAMVSPSDARPPGLRSLGPQSILVFSDDFDAVLLIAALARDDLMAVWELQHGQWTPVSSMVPPFHASEVQQFFRDVDGRGVVALVAPDLGRSPHMWRLSRSGWLQLDTPVPLPPRGGAAIYRDATKGVLYFYGGGGRAVGATRGPSASYNDFWEWNGRSWTELAAPNRSATAEGVFIASDNASQPVLFGGRSAQYGGDDAWQWTGDGWRPVTNPIGALAGAAYATDEVGRTVIVGGLQPSAQGWVPSESWYLCSAGRCAGHPITTAGPPTGLARIAYDPNNRSFVLLEDVSVNKADHFETWTYAADGHWAHIV